MIYVLSKLFWFLAQPFNFILLLLAAALVFLRWQKSRALGLGLLKGAAIALLVCTVLPVGPLLLLPIENRFPKLDPLPAHVDGIIVLGGSIDAGVSEGRDVVALTEGAERETMLLRLAHLYPEARLLYSGGSSGIFRKEFIEADLGRRFIIEQGIDPSRFIAEGVSRNTWENAIESKKLADPKAGETWLLITSAYHMPRSVGIFRKVGWNVTPCTVDFRTSGRPRWLQFRYLDRMLALDLAFREYYGLTAYWILGRTSSLFPGPA